LTRYRSRFYRRKIEFVRAEIISGLPADAAAPIRAMTPESHLQQGVQTVERFAQDEPADSGCGFPV
jgi:hypothetical protein